MVYETNINIYILEVLFLINFQKFGFSLYEDGTNSNVKDFTKWCKK